MHLAAIGILATLALAAVPAHAGDLLLLEAADDGSTNAVPFSGTVTWSTSVDEKHGLTLEAHGVIPSKDISLTIRYYDNTDATVPADQMFEISFEVPDTFLGGSIKHLPGLLYKDEELVQGTPIEGASAKIVGNKFLFATSSAATVRTSVMEKKRWLDIAAVYETGRRAIITLELDDAARKAFGTIQ